MAVGRAVADFSNICMLAQRLETTLVVAAVYARPVPVGT
jgi:hypothetical protein